MAAILLLAALVAGCGPIYWQRPGATQEEFRRDSYVCERDAAMLPRMPQTVTTGAWGVPVYSDPSMGWGDVARQERLYNQCMEAAGYRRVAK